MFAFAAARQVRNLAVRALPDVGEQGVEVRASLPFPAAELAKCIRG